MQILLAVDGSAYTKKMLAYIAAHDEWLGTHHAYTIVTVVPAIPGRAASMVSKDELKAYYAEEGEKIFKPIRKFFEKQNIHASYIARTGHAADVIVAQAEKANYDLLIMGSHGHGSLGSLVMGSIVSKVMSKTTVPVLIVR